MTRTFMDWIMFIGSLFILIGVGLFAVWGTLGLIEHFFSK